jgi:hypothetical protein
VSLAARYATFDLLILVGCYLALLDSPTVPGPNVRKSIQPQLAPGDALEKFFDWTMDVKAAGWNAILTVTIRTALVFAIFFQVFLGTDYGMANGRAWHQEQLLTADVTVNIDHAPNNLVRSALYPNPYFEASFIRSMAHFARKHHLSLFATSDVALYTKKGLPGDHTAPSTSIRLPATGATLKGNVWLVASAVDDYQVARVEFHMTAVQGGEVFVATTTPFQYGWLGGWKTTSVPDGPYTLTSVAYDAAGNRGSSTSRPIVVAN